MPFPNEEREFQLPDAFATIAVKSEAQSDTDTNTDDVSTPRERQRNESKNECIYRQYVSLFITSSNCFDRKKLKILYNWVNGLAAGTVHDVPRYNFRSEIFLAHKNMMSS